MTCAYNCYDSSASPVELEGCNGAGENCAVAVPSVDACTQLCTTASGCEAVVFGGGTCYGKKDVHTSKCAAGNGFQTIIVNGAPWGKCAALGDPHILTFDHPQATGSPYVDKIEGPGEYAFVKSDSLTINGRFGYTKDTPEGVSTIGLALSGTMIKGHTMTLTYVGPTTGHAGFQIQWDGADILTNYPDTFTAPDGCGTITKGPMDPTNFHPKARHTIGDSDDTKSKAQLPSLYIELKPDVNIYVLYGPDSINVVMEMKKLPGRQGGYCGNFNCNPDDDTLPALEASGDADKVDDSLFDMAKDPPEEVTEDKHIDAPKLDDCPEDLKAKATAACQSDDKGAMAACIYDVCASGKIEVGEEEMHVSEVDPESYNCLSNTPLNSWTQEKREWCCKEEQVGCPMTTTSKPYNCKTDLANSEVEWSAAKKIYCCAEEKLGCPKPTVTTTPRPTVTTTTVTTVTTTTTRRTYLPGQTTTTQLYDCLSGENMDAWSRAKKAWCCAHDHVACPTTTTLPYNCYDGDAAGFAPAKQAWCCAKENVACPTTTTTLPMDCDASAEAISAWSGAKKAWCCENRNVGCPDSSPPDHDCAVAVPYSWSVAKKAYCCFCESLGCPPATSTSSTTSTTTPYPLPTTTTPKPMEPLSCDLNCYGEGASPVLLPGCQGEGDDCAVSGLDEAGCEDLCKKTPECNGFTYGRGMCYGKKDIHLSHCQPGGQDYKTNIFKEPWSKCVIMGDPHALPFDKPHGPGDISQFTPGAYTLIKSDVLLMHGLFGYTERFPTAASTTGFALTGSAIGGHTLVVEYTGPDKGHAGFKVLWDKKEILVTYPGSFTSSDGVMKATAEDMEPTDFHKDSRHTIGDTAENLGKLQPSYYFEFDQAEINIYCLIGPDSMNAVIEMKKLPGEQDGYCGNFNCVQLDETVHELAKRGHADQIPVASSLFRDAPTQAPWMLTDKGPAPKLEDCPEDLKEKAAIACQNSRTGEKEACMYDVCAAKDTAVAKEDIEAGHVETMPYDCHSQPVNWMITWAAAKKAWCCANEAVGCPVTTTTLPIVCKAKITSTTTTTTTTTTKAFDCQVDLDKADKEWSTAKKLYCCQKQGLGCAVSSTSAMFDCYDGLTAEWGLGKRSWCCKNEQLGCPSTTSRSFDCHDVIALLNSCKEQKEWCCINQGIGCEVTTTQAIVTSLPYDCLADYTDCPVCLAKRWSVTKRTWCCQHQGRGCPTTTTSFQGPYDCMAGYNNWVKGWSVGKKAWCCEHEQRGCYTTAVVTTSLPYDCNADWTPCYHCVVKHWSVGKLAWCCQHANRGCPTTSTAPSGFDCNAGYNNWVAGWSIAKKSWCCQHASRGCATTSLPYDCAAGIAHWQKGWSIGKKAWCCQHAGKGCERPSTHCPYDCEAGYSNWEKGWSEGKKVFCCKHYNRGCTGAAVPFQKKYKEAGTEDAIGKETSTSEIPAWGKASFLVIGLGFVAGCFLHMVPISSIMRRGHRYTSLAMTEEGFLTEHEDGRDMVA